MDLPTHLAKIDELLSEKTHLFLGGTDLSMFRAYKRVTICKGRSCLSVLKSSNMQNNETKYAD